MGCGCESWLRGLSRLREPSARQVGVLVFVAVSVILGGCFSVRGAEDRTILYICSKVVCFLVSRPVVRPGR